MENGLALRRAISAILAEYNAKAENISNALATFNNAGDVLKNSSTISGTWSEVRIDTGIIYSQDIERSLVTSAWLHMYNMLNIDYLATAQDKKRFKTSIANPPEFTMDNIRATFGHYLEDPRYHILRGLAEAFCSLDPVYKSHEKVKIGVQGLPKRVILSNVGGWGSWGMERMRDCVNAICAVKGLPLTDWQEKRDEESGQIKVYGIRQLLEDGNYMRESHGIWLKKYGNGNGHLFFSPSTLREINLALAEFYGDVLPDAVEPRPNKPRASTEVSRELQFYATPAAAAQELAGDYERLIKGKSVLEPSCGDGRLMVAARAAGASEVFGIEVDPMRAQQARQKGFNVLTANFLDVPPEPKFDFVFMNPPFYGKHYAKHVLHAMKFLKPDGVLRAILPITARDHGLVDGRFEDMPIGSFRESGTNINTTILTTSSRYQLSY